MLDLRGLEGAGLPSCRISRVRCVVPRAGKKIFVYGQGFTQRQYYLAAQADEVYLDPMGYVLLDGYSYYRNYFRGTLDKLAVDVNLFKVGSHKSAPEDWTRTDMSPEDRESAKVWIGALWDGYKDDVAAARDLEPALIQAYADEAATACARPRDTAQYALARGLVDGLKTHIGIRPDPSRGVAAKTRSGASMRSTWRSDLSIARADDGLGHASDPKIGVDRRLGRDPDARSCTDCRRDTLAGMLRDLRLDAITQPWCSASTAPAAA